MPRPVKIRKLIVPQKEITFMPAGFTNEKGKNIILLTEEFEAIKLIDYENMNHLEASKILGISRPTLTRIYSKARRKIAECLIEQKELRVEGGNSILGENWFKCNSCESVFNLSGVGKASSNCPVCFSKSTGELK